MMNFACPTCKMALSAPHEKAGAKTACPYCGQRLQVPTRKNQTVLGEELPAQEERASLPLPESWWSQAPTGAIIAVNCPACLKDFQVPVSEAGQKLACPTCGQRVQVPGQQPTNKTVLGKLGNPPEVLDVIPVPLSEIPPPLPTISPTSSAATPAPLPLINPNDSNEVIGLVCGILSLVFGLIAFGFCPPLFGIAGIALGIIGACLSRNKALGISGVVLSAVGMVVGLLLGFLMLTQLRF
jgi:DNA-directed RNA polymerase subunit RPC12/RpoP